MSTGRVIDRDAGWQDITIHKGDPDQGRIHKALVMCARAVVWSLVLIAGFIRVNWLITLVILLPLWLWSAGLSWVALSVAVVLAVGFGTWFWFAPESFDIQVITPLRKWVRRRRYRAKWADLMVGSRLTVRDSKRQELIPGIARIKQGRFADVLVVRMPSAMTTERFAEKLPEIIEDMRARDARIIPAPGRRTPGWLDSRRSTEFAPTDTRRGKAYVRLAFGDPLVHLVTTMTTDIVDFSKVRVGRRDDGKDWLVALLGTHILLAGATGAGKGSVLWSLLASLGPAIRSGLVQVVGIDPKGGMELGYGRELFRQLLTMDGSGAEVEAVEFLESLADEADRRASLLAGKSRKLEPSESFPFLVIVIDELASITAFIADSKLRQRADAALGRLLTKGRAPGMCVIGALQDPRKEVVKWRDLFPTRIALRLVEKTQVDMVLGDGARARGAKCDHIAESAPGVGYVVEDGSQAVTRVRAAYLTDADIRQLAQTFKPGPVVAQPFQVVQGGDAA